MQYRNATFAFVRELEQVLERGRPITVRGKATHELLARTVSLAEPLERFITVPGRRNDPFAVIAETMWVIAGRDDLEFLSRYLGRATDFSDDGATWRGGYGPRLRNWQGVDQVDEIRKLLLEDPESRRAVAVMFDPARDFDNSSQDVPCNNWLHFMLRDGRLDLDVVIRSNDILWGFSGINTFEWSVLHELMAYWLDAKVGTANFFISSLHLYDEYEERAKACLSGFDERSGYESGCSSSTFATDWDRFGELLDRWFEIEAGLVAGDDEAAEIDAFPDPLLREFLRALRVKWRRQHGADESQIRAMIAALGRTDVALAIHEWLFKDSRAHLPTATDAVDIAGLELAIIDLHRSKDASYGNSWKRRGEQVSILANIARKSDRIENVTAGSPTGKESLLETAADLFVYALKYETFLADSDPTAASTIFGYAGTGFSDGPRGFEELIGQRGLATEFGEITEEAAAVVMRFDALDKLVRLGSPTLLEKASAARALTEAAGRLLLAIASRMSQPLDALRQEIG